MAKVRQRVRSEGGAAKVERQKNFSAAAVRLRMKISLDLKIRENQIGRDRAR